ncbi:EF-P lysine aminoacylase EpmA [Thermostilla marina]
MADDWHPTANLEMLVRRAELFRSVRRFFDERRFLEVDTPLLSHDTVIDRHIDPFRVYDRDALPSDHDRPLFLQTSPEFAMKRLAAAGARAIYQITHAFRRGECGARHNPEFAILEWYRVGDDAAKGMALLSDLAEHLFRRGPAEIVTYRDAFRRFAGVDPFACGGESNDDLMQAIRERQIVLPDGFDVSDRDALLDVLLVECVQPNLGTSRPVILCDYPPSQAALAVVREGDPPAAERFELFVDGVELANGYHELRDPAVLRVRQQEANRARGADGKRPLPEENRLLAAMESGFPPCAGAAMGLDRVLMLQTGAADIREVMPFPFDRA